MGGHTSCTLSIMEHCCQLRWRLIVRPGLLARWRCLRCFGAFLWSHTNITAALWRSSLSAVGASGTGQVILLIMASLSHHRSQEQGGHKKKHNSVSVSKSVKCDRDSSVLNMRQSLKSNSQLDGDPPVREEHLFLICPQLDKRHVVATERGGWRQSHTEKKNALRTASTFTTGFYCSLTK